MENQEEKSGTTEDPALTRNRSFKSKQLVRSQAIREAASPPRASSPAAPTPPDSPAGECLPEVSLDDGYEGPEGDRDDVDVDTEPADAADTVRSADGDSHFDDASVGSAKASDEEYKKGQQVEIQITGASAPWSPPRVRARRWALAARRGLPPGPRRACVCGACGDCPHCRGRRWKPTFEDSGIVISDECPDWSDSEPLGMNKDGTKKAVSLDSDEPTFYCRCPERKEKPMNISLNRTDSDESSSPPLAELVAFLQQTLNKSPRDRCALLRIEKELHSLVMDAGRCVTRFPAMGSYGRLLVHRAAALFQLMHFLDKNARNAVIVTKSGTAGGRIPCTSFRAWCTAVFPPAAGSPPRPGSGAGGDIRAKSILKRSGTTLDSTGSNGVGVRSRSLEQRERDYERVRRRIFSTDNCTSQEEPQWPWQGSGPVRLLAPNDGRNKLLKVQSLETASPPGSGRGAVAKSHSFGGYGGADPPRLLSRQGDLACSRWRASPSSSGYRTLSLHSADSVTPSPTGGASPEPAAERALVWAVTDMAEVPKGALVIHPQTGRALTNADGSLYLFDPERPPPLATTQQRSQIEESCEKRRSRLEKQQSFIENEGECQVSDECTGKCCCECRRREQQEVTQEPEPTPPEDDTPQSPTKVAYQPIETANHSTPPELTNHMPFEQANPSAPIEPQQYDIQNYTASLSRPPRQGSANRYENWRQQSYDSNKYEFANHRADYSNHRQYVSQESQEVQYLPQYMHYGLEENVSVSVGYTGAVQSPALAKPQMPEHAMRPMSIGNVLYPAPMPQPYPYVNQFRTDPGLVYQPTLEEKPMTPSHTEGGFRIDPSYPYAAMDYSACCAAGCEPRLRLPAGVPVAAPGTTAGYGTIPGYAVDPSCLPAMRVPHYPQYHQDAMQWLGAMPPKLLMPELCPMLPCGYPPLQMYPALATQAVGADLRRNAPLRRPSLTGSARATPHQPPPEDKKVPYDNHTYVNHNPIHNLNHNQNHGGYNLNHNNNRAGVSEIAIQIQQIKEQMAALNTGGRVEPPAPAPAPAPGALPPGPGERREWRRRNSGSGLLGTHPAVLQAQRNALGAQVAEVGLSSAARAIVHSIRSMQAKNQYGDRVWREGAGRGRRPDRPDRPDRAPNAYRQMSPGTWCRRSPGPVHPVFNPRRPHPDTRQPRR